MWNLKLLTDSHLYEGLPKFQSILELIAWKVSDQFNAHLQTKIDPKDVEKIARMVSDEINIEELIKKIDEETRVPSQPKETSPYPTEKQVIN